MYFIDMQNQTDSEHRRTRFIGCFVSDLEYEKVGKRFKESGARSLSAYYRAQLLGSRETIKVIDPALKRLLLCELIRVGDLITAWPAGPARSAALSVHKTYMGWIARARPNQQG